MAIRVRLSTPLRRLVDGASEVEGRGGSVRSLIEDLDRRFPGFGARVLDDGGGIREFVLVYVNQRDVRTLGGPETALRDGDEVAILPAMAGGSRWTH